MKTFRRVTGLSIVSALLFSVYTFAALPYSCKASAPCQDSAGIRCECRFGHCSTSYVWHSYYGVVMHSHVKITCDCDGSAVTTSTCMLPYEYWL